MDTKLDSPGVKIPPPLFYVVTFLLSVFIQKHFFINYFIFQSLPFKIAAVVLILISLTFIIPALLQFIKTKNTVITVKPANSLQVSGVYSVSRNPMYLGLLLLYAGLVFLAGNWWTIIFMPVLITAITLLIILPEEHYLQREFGETYSLYKEKVRRWL
ncbi:MAG: isoprenylcysteine carboxylmethyltransferase family protein [Mucilaginibacter sp.]|jgi:protein-S-isoprenylcysteine O-methyltransferase Ste14|nr:isoprenylcysteine carboxylmethyltransferase family protein [Mucilaginibacter sp.]